MIAALFALLLAFPHVAMYSGVKPNGTPYMRPDHSADYWAQIMTARFDAVILDATPTTDYAPEIVEGLRMFNPEIKLYALVLSVYIHPRIPQALHDAWGDTTTAYYCELTRAVTALDGYLYTQSGAQGIPYANVNLADTLVAKAMADVWLSRIVGSGLWDGMLFDLYCPNPSWAQDPNDRVDYARHGYASEADYWTAFAAGHRWMSEYLRERVPVGFKLIGNCGSDPAPAFDGWMRENFPKQGGGSWDSNMLGFGGLPGYLTSGTDNWLTMPFAPWPQPMTAYGKKWARFGLASACMGSGYFAAVGTDWDAYRGFAPWWLDEYAVDGCGRASGSPNDKGWLGEPMGEPLRSGSVWVRDFERGLVIVNPTKQTQSATVYGAYRYIFGEGPNTGKRAPRTITLGPEDAIFLWREW